MSKIQRISYFQHELSFFNVQENFDIYYHRFLTSDLGKIHTAIPFDNLIKSFKLKEKHKGTKNLFSPKGKIALMFLKHYAACSDKKLIEQLNGNINYQFFCDIYIGTNSLLNYKIVRQIRCELSQSLNIPKIEKELFSYWSLYIKEQQCVFTDATCYESEVRFPTSQKLLWEAVLWTYHQTKTICKHLKIKLPRTKFLKWKSAILIIAKCEEKQKRNAML